ncbi:MAG: glycosyltransferase family 4 protein [Candidatus Omnitrophica bacterium]|nr:glycosyltransferase family 4 protein [Candidatus Omnitrophota bacterium]
MQTDNDTITIGYFDWLASEFISAIVLRDTFVRGLSRYVTIVPIPITRPDEVKEHYRRIGEYGLDYLYVDMFNSFIESFIVREALGSRIRFIVHCHAALSWISRYMYVLPLLRSSDILCTPSHYAQKSLRLLSPRFESYRVPYCLDVCAIQSSLPKVPRAHKKSIAFMGRLVPSKGIGLLIECMPEIIQRVGDTQLTIIGPLSGEGKSDRPMSPYVVSLKRLVHELHLEENIHFAGACFGPEKYQLLAHSDLFINPTCTLDDTFSVCNIEAFACGIPVITTDWAAHREIITHEKTGFLIGVRCDEIESERVAEKEQLISAAVNLLSDETLCSTMGQNAYKEALRYDYATVLPDFIQHLKKQMPTAGGIGWESVKDKTLCDFKDLFNTEMHFFLHIDHHMRSRTFSDLYNLCTSRKKRRVTAEEIDNVKHKTQADELLEKIRRDFLYSLLPEENRCALIQE